MTDPLIGLNWADTSAAAAITTAAVLAMRYELRRGFERLNRAWRKHARSDSAEHDATVAALQNLSSAVERLHCARGGERAGPVQPLDSAALPSQPRAE